MGDIPGRSLFFLLVSHRSTPGPAAAAAFFVRQTMSYVESTQTIFGILANSDRFKPSITKEKKKKKSTTTRNFPALSNCLDIGGSHRRWFFLSFCWRISSLSSNRLSETTAAALVKKNSQTTEERYLVDRTQ